ncbi:MAG: hypothetical protein DRO15_08020 [Thermoprotei archaeon]|nr:MAG: hypothetical protein DRO15_08020 [Thermoprotei archaeon]
MSANPLREILSKYTYIHNIVQNYEFETFFMSQSIEYRHFLEDNPLASIIATICDWKINTDDTWSMLYKMYHQLKQQNLNFDANTIAKLGKERIRSFLEEFMINKWPSMMSREDRVDQLEKTSQWIVDACRYIAIEGEGLGAGYFLKRVWYAHLFYIDDSLFIR